MRNFLFPSGLILSFMLVGCTGKVKTQTTSIKNNSTTYSWEQVLPFGNGSFQEEYKKGTFPLGLKPILAFDGNLWMVGQKQAWWSDDGTNWTETNKKDWGERIYSSTVFFNNKLWLYGGMKYKERKFINDIWSSADGKNWETTKNAEWSPRGGQTLIVFKNKLWALGGSNGIQEDAAPNQFLNDVWSSEDGLTWKQETNAALWSPRDYPRVVVFKDSLYMLGGQGTADIWRSADGVNWEQINPHAAWDLRYDEGALVYDNKLWIFGGRDTSTNHTTAAKNDVWFSENGKDWQQQTEHAPWTVRSAATSIVFKDKIWIYSGKHTGGEHNWGGDVWTMRK